jgi:hypothetical protein
MIMFRCCGDIEILHHIETYLDMRTVGWEGRGFIKKINNGCFITQKIQAIHPAPA